MRFPEAIALVNGTIMVLVPNYDFVLLRSDDYGATFRPGAAETIPGTLTVRAFAAIPLHPPIGPVSDVEDFEGGDEAAGA